MPFFGKQFYDDETVWLASLAYQGLYVALLWCQWRERSIPDDVRMVARLVGQPEREVRKLWPEVRKHFAAVDDQPGRLANANLEVIRENQKAFSDKQSSIADARWGARRMPDEYQNDARPDANGMPARAMLPVAVAIPSSNSIETSSLSRESRSGGGYIVHRDGDWAPPWTERQFQYKADKIAEWVKAKSSLGTLPETDDFNIEFEAEWGMSYDRWLELRPKCEAFFSRRTA